MDEIYRGLEFEVGSWTVVVDIIDIDNNEIDFRITDSYQHPNMPIFTAEDGPVEDDVRDEVYYYAEEEGLINV